MNEARERLLRAFQSQVASRIPRPKTRDEAFKYLIDNGEEKFVRHAIDNGMTDEEIIDGVHDIMLADQEEAENAPPEDDGELTWEDVFGEPRPEQEDDDDWRESFGPNRPEKPSQYADDDFEFTQHLSEENARQRIGHYRKQIDELTDTPSQSKLYNERLFQFLKSIETDLHASNERALLPFRAGVVGRHPTIKHVMEMAQELGIANPPPNSRELIKAIGEHVRGHSDNAAIVHYYHNKANELASRAANDDHWHAVGDFYKSIPDEHAHAVAKRLGAEVRETPRKTRAAIADHIWEKAKAHPAAAEHWRKMKPIERPGSAAASTMQATTVSHAPVVDSQASTRMK